MCRYFGSARASFYHWKSLYKKDGEAGLVNKKPIPKNPTNRTPIEVVEKVLHLRQAYHLEPIRIVQYLARYHDIKISGAGVYRILTRNGLNRLPRETRLRQVQTIKYQKQVPGHQIQVDVKFLTFKDKDGKPIKRYQYTAIEDAIRVRAVKIYERHNQANAISFIEYDLMTDSNTSNWAFSQLISHPALIRTDFLSKLMGDLIPVAEHLRVC